MQCMVNSFFLLFLTLPTYRLHCKAKYISKCTYIDYADMRTPAKFKLMSWWGRRGMSCRVFSTYERRQGRWGTTMTGIRLRHESTLKDDEIEWEKKTAMLFLECLSGRSLREAKVDPVHLTVYLFLSTSGSNARGESRA